MRVIVFSCKPFERDPLQQANAGHGHDLELIETSLTERTSGLASGRGCVCAFVNDRLDAGVLRTLRAGGTALIALRSAGFNHVDLAEAERLGMTILRVPAYSPHAVAEHTVGLILTLNRKLHRAYARVREHNFAIDGLMGFDLNGKTAGIVGTGKIGAVVSRILTGFGCRVLGFDPSPNEECTRIGVRYVPLDELLTESDIVLIHCPLTPQTHHLFDAQALGRMKQGAMLINTSRGAVVDTRALIGALKSGRLGHLGLDVYEEEGDLFFRDLSEQVLQDDVLARLLTFPNVVITAHQGFFTREAVNEIARTTIGNITAFERGRVDENNRVTGRLVAPAR